MSYSPGLPSVRFNKVAEVGLVFWIIKMMSTTVGETGADFLIFKLHWGLVITSLVMLFPLLLCLFTQIRSTGYRHWLYWLTVVLVSIAGTLITDLLTDHWHVPLVLSSSVFSILLVLIFIIWYKEEKDLSIRTINTRQREIFYWSAILVTFALGTAVGDWVSESLGWGYLVAAIIFSGLILATATAHYGFKVNAIICFWIAYILTRPLGASMGDYLSHSVKKGGLGLGTVNTSLVFLLIIVALVAYLTFTDKPNAQQTSTQ
jgi:uncharacterized membrane-anchored protein